MRFPNLHFNNLCKGNLNRALCQIATEIEASIVEPVFAVSSCEELVLPVPLPPLLIDLCTQIMTLTAIGGVRNNHLLSSMLIRLTADLSGGQVRGFVFDITNSVLKNERNCLHGPTANAPQLVLDN